MTNHQPPSAIISCHHQLSSTISYHQLSLTTSHHQLSSAVNINYHQLPSAIISYHQLSSTTSHHQLSSAVISYHQLPLAVVSYRQLPTITGIASYHKQRWATRHCSLHQALLRHVNVLMSSSLGRRGCSKASATYKTGCRLH